MRFVYGSILGFSFCHEYTNIGSEDQFTASIDRYAAVDTVVGREVAGRCCLGENAAALAKLLLQA